MPIIASSYMQIFFSFDFSEIASWNIEQNILISKKILPFLGLWPRLTGYCRISIQITPRFSRPEKWYHNNSYASARSEHRAAESSETKYTENLSTKELIEQRRQFALQYGKITAFVSCEQKKKIETLGRNASQKNRNSET